MFVCICKQISLKDLIQVKKENPSISFEEAVGCLNFGSDCGTCNHSEEYIKKQWENASSSSKKPN